MGNEFGSYPGYCGLSYDEWSPKILAWSLEMAAYIKKVGSQSFDLMEAGGADRKALLADPNIDIISDHLYEYWNRMGRKINGNFRQLQLRAKSAKETADGR